MRFWCMASGAIDKAMSGRVDLSFINIQRYLAPFSVGGKKFRIAVTFQTVILIEGLSLVGVYDKEQDYGDKTQRGKEN